MAAWGHIARGPTWLMPEGRGIQVRSGAGDSDPTRPGVKSGAVALPKLGPGSRRATVTAEGASSGS